MCYNTWTAQLFSRAQKRHSSLHGAVSKYCAEETVGYYFTVLQFYVYINTMQRETLYITTIYF